MSIESVMPSNHLILCRPLLLLPSIFPSIRVFSSESALCIRWPKYWSFSFNIRPSNEHPGLISFRMDWLDLLAVQGILKSLLQHHSLKAPILRHSAFFTVQLSHPYITSRKTIAYSIGKESACKAGDLHSIPGSGRSPGEGNNNPLQYSYLGNIRQRSLEDYSPQGRKSRTRPSDCTHTPPPPNTCRYIFTYIHLYMYLLKHTVESYSAIQKNEIIPSGAI